MRISYQDAMKRYGVIKNGIWEDEAKWCVLLIIKDSIGKNWINTATGKQTTHIYVNRDMSTALTQALALVEKRGLVSNLKTFDGAFCLRDVRAEPGKPSCHSYGLAIDINAKTNGIGNEHGDMPIELVRCFFECGFTWGGKFRRIDGMHFSFAWE
jgi:hypothetical protein